MMRTSDKGDSREAQRVSHANGVFINRRKASNQGDQE
jgi:hypothetical protein